MTSPPYRLEIDSAGVLFPPLHADAVMARDWMATIEPAIEKLLKWTGILGDAGVHPYSPSSSNNVVVGISRGSGAAAFAGWSATRDPSQPSGTRYEGRLELGSEIAAADVLAHEYIHLLTEHAYAPLGGLEQGALAEHYSDIIGTALFPATAPHDEWDLASESRGGAIRNLLNPTSPHTPSGQFAIDHVASKSRCDPVRADCTYEWLGIPNRAAALIAAGVDSPAPGTTPLGRDTMVRLFFETIREPGGGPFQMQSVDRFLNQRLKVLALCHYTIGRSGQVHGLPEVVRWAGSRTISSSDCENLARAFDAVGVVAAQSSGFDRFNTYRTRPWTQTIWSGSRLHNGCSIAGHSINIEVRRDSTVRINISRLDTDTPPLLVSTFGGEVTAAVTHRCGSNSASSCPDPTNRAVTYVVDSKWDWPGDSSSFPWNVWVEEQQSVPQGLDPSACLQPLHTERALYWSTPIVHTGSAFFIGKRETRVLAPNGTPFLAGNCELLEIAGVDSHRTGLAPSITREGWTSTFNHGNHGFTVTYIGTQGPRDYTAELRTWADGFSGIFARVLYWLARPAGGDCAFPGLDEVPRHLWESP